MKKLLLTTLSLFCCTLMHAVDVSTFSELITAINNNSDINLTCDIRDTSADAKKQMSDFQEGYPTYSSTCEGNGHTVVLPQYYSSNISNVALFPETQNAVIRNLTVEVTSIYSLDHVAGIVGRDDYGSTIQNCTVSGVLEAHSHAAGGIIAESKGGTTIESCTNNATVTSNYYCGGIIGYITGTGVTIKGCINNGSVTADPYTMWNTDYPGYSVGGIVGENDKDTSDTNLTIIGCTNNGAVTGEYYVGGILGRQYQGCVTIACCDSHGSIKSSDCKNPSTMSAAAIMGYGQKGSVTVNSCFYDCAANLYYDSAWHDEMPICCGTKNATLAITNVVMPEGYALPEGDGNINATTDQISGGYATYYLAQAAGTDNCWQQNLDNDLTPDTRPLANYKYNQGTHGTVYQLMRCDDVTATDTYSNTKSAVHNINSETGICTVCNWSTDGTAKIYTAQQLRLFAHNVNKGRVQNAILMADISLDGDDMVNWNADGPIGRDVAFYRTFDGNSHTISYGTHLTADAIPCNIFSQVMGATIKNLTITGQMVTKQQYAGMVGTVLSNTATPTTISNCHISASHSFYYNGAAACAAFVGRNKSSNLVISDCMLDGTISLNEPRTDTYATGCAGFVGSNESGSKVTISRCLMTTTFSGQQDSDNTTANFVCSNGGTMSINNSFYTEIFPVCQGTLTTDDELKGINIAPFLQWGLIYGEGKYPQYGYNDNKVTYTYDLNNEWTTLCVPFAFRANNTTCTFYKPTAFGINADNTAYEITVESYADGTIIPAGTPMLVKRKGSAATAVTLNSDGTAASDEKSVKISDVMYLNGTYSQLINQVGMFFVAEDKFWYAETTNPITIPANRAWLQSTPTASVAAKAIGIIEADAATGISQTESIQPAGVRKVFVNGKILIKKGNVTYSVSGQKM